MNVLLYRVGQPPALTPVTNDLSAFQALVGGLIQPVDLPNDYVLICNDEGLLLGLAPNVQVGGAVIAGNVFVVKIDPDDPDQWTGVTADDVPRIRPWIRRVSPAVALSPRD